MHDYKIVILTYLQPRKIIYVYSFLDSYSRRHFTKKRRRYQFITLRILHERAKGDLWGERAGDPRVTGVKQVQQDANPDRASGRNVFK